MPKGALHIVGAGPVGSMLACLLEKSGREVHIWEKRTSFPDCSMAIGITPPSLALLDHLNLGDAFRQEGILIQQAQVYEQGVQQGVLDFGSPERAILSLPQQRTVEHLRRKFRSFPDHQFHLGEAFPGLDSLEKSDWVIACDGARSPLREELGIPFPHRPYRVQFVMADFPDLEHWGAPARLFFSATGAVESFPLPGGLRRWIAQVPTESSPSLDLLCRRVRDTTGISLSSRPHSDVWPFTPEWGLAKRYHQKQVILCGDAAHVMSPIGGQGMNTGFADAFHLSNILPAPTSEDVHTYQKARSRAFKLSARRAAWGMFLGSRTGPGWSLTRRWIISGMLKQNASHQFLARTFSMQNQMPPVFS